MAAGSGRPDWLIFFNFIMWLLDVSWKFQGVGDGSFASHVVLVLETLNQFVELILELYCVLDCHLVCVHFLLIIARCLSKEHWRSCQVFLTINIYSISTKVAIICTWSK
jgi:hypothetical protein